jgi:hypothetical protein
MRSLLVLGLSALLLLPAAAQTGRAPLSIMKTRHLAIQVKVNGAGPFRVILDTGAPITFFSNRVAVQAKLLPADQASRPALFGLRGQVKAQSVEVGGIVIRDMPVMVLDHPTIQQINAVDGPVDGIVGLSFFGRYRTTLDYAKGELLLEPGTYVPPDVTGGLTQRLLSRQPAAVRVVAPAGLWGLKVEKTDEAPGVRVAEVLEGSAAHSAGLKPGDRLLTLGGRWTDTVAECYDAAALAPPGEPAVARIARDGKEMDLEVRPRVGL